MAKVTALLANGPGIPAGDVSHGMELSVCLTPQGQIDRASYLVPPLPWRTRCSWPHLDEWRGKLILVDERSWALRAERDADEPLWNLALYLLRPGECLTLRPPSGEELVFRIVQVAPG